MNQYRPVARGADGEVDWKQYILDRVEIDHRGCWKWQCGCFKAGYGRVSTIHAQPRVQTAHRVSWKAFRGTIPDELCVLHQCDVRTCVNPEHLFLGTKKDNTQDMIRKGRRTQTRLTQAQVDEIRASTETHAAVGRRLKYNRAGIRRIRLGQLWPVTA